MNFNQPYKTIIIDDEQPARIRIRQLAADFPKIIKIEDEAENGDEAVKKINQLHPDLIFLDIRMPGMDGFEVLKHIEHMPVVVFCTAFDEFALKAFDANCVDYLLKPLTKERFEQTIQKLEKLNGADKQLNIQQLLEQLAPVKKNEEVTTVPVKLGDRVLFLRLEDISYFKADEKYISIKTKQAKNYILDSSLKKLEEKLPAHFIRVHKSFIINKNLLKEVRKHFNNRFVLILEDYEQTRITSGRNYFQDVKELFEF